MVAQPRLAAVGGREIGDEVGESLHQLAQLVGQRGIVATEPRGERLALRFRHPRELGDEDLDSSVDRGATFGVAHSSAPPGSLSSAVAAAHTISTTAFAAGHLSYSCQAPLREVWSRVTRGVKPSWKLHGGCARAATSSLRFPDFPRRSGRRSARQTGSNGCTKSSAAA